MIKNRRTPSKTIINSKIMILGLFFILVLISISLIKNVNKNKIISDKTLELDREIKKIEEENKNLEELIAYFSTPEFLDKEAREKLNMAKPGEKIIIIPQEDKNLASVDNKEMSDKKNYVLWWDYFFNN